ncbi:MAG: sigma-54-dependent transcriptional regulator [Planctomycetota bacterium]
MADDEESMRYFVSRGLERHGFVVDAVDNGTAAIERFDAHPHDVAVLDLRMPGRDGIEVLRHIHNRDPETIVIVITAFGSIASAVEAMKLGAFEYVTKPFEIDELILLIDRAISHRTTVREHRDLRQLVDTRTEHAGLVGQSAAMRAVFDRINLLRNSDATVLIRGESGTGKELVARAIHMESRRASGQFVAVNCAAIPQSLFENELFGHEPGAYTGATTPKAGLCSRADGGTLFIDEVSQMPLAAQAKLERFLQDKSVQRLGASQPVEVDVRVCAATGKDLEQLVAEDKFRREFYFRLNVIAIQLPALRERREDVPALIDHFLNRMRGEGPCDLQGFTVDAALAMGRYNWPGNVRELQNTLERLVVMNPGREPGRCGPPCGDRRRPPVGGVDPVRLQGRCAELRTPLLHPAAPERQGQHQRGGSNLGPLPRPSAPQDQAAGDRGGRLPDIGRAEAGTSSVSYGYDACHMFALSITSQER